MRLMVRYTVVIAAAAAVYLIWTLASRSPREMPPERAKQPNRPALQEDYAATTGRLKIVQFYAYPSWVTEGERATLCYGVSGTKSLKLDPPVEEVLPARNRCFPITPDNSTRYTLTAQAADGRTVSESFVLEVKPDLAIRPKIVYFLDRGRQASSQVVGGATEQRAVHSLCFQAENVKEVRIDPPVLPPTSAIRGCFYVTPSKTTTYTLTVIGPKERKAERQLTVKVPDGGAQKH